MSYQSALSLSASNGRWEREGATVPIVVVDHHHHNNSVASLDTGANREQRVYECVCVRALIEPMPTS